MGCVGSKPEDKRPNVFRVINVDRNGEELWSGHIEITSVNLTLYRKHKPLTQWPLQCLRRYGYENDTFSFEAGRRAPTGQGIYSLRCREAEHLFSLLQQYIHVSTYNNNNNNNNSNNSNHLTVSSLDEFQHQHASLLNTGGHTPTIDGDLTDGSEVRRNVGLTSSSNYIVLHSGGGGGAAATALITQSPSQSISPNGTLNSLSQDNSQDRSNNNYLEPLTSAGCTTENSRFATGQRLNSLGSATGIDMLPLSPDSNGMELVSLYSNTTNFVNNNSYTGCSNAQTNAAAYCNVPDTTGNVYHEMSLAHTIANDGAVDTSTAEQESVGATKSTFNQSLLRLRSLLSTEEVNASGQEETGLGGAGTPTYMNITPGEMSTSSSHVGRFSRMNSNFSTTSVASERCYENLDPTILASLTTPGIRHHSRPDIFAKIDLPLANSPSMLDAVGGLRTEPCTPTTAMANRMVNYIVLDLDAKEESNSNNNSSNNNQTPMASNNTAVPTSVTAENTVNAAGVAESPKKVATTFGYATIDFNKTVALSNTTNPTADVDCEGSRKTRHSSTAVHALRHNSHSISD